MAALLTSLMILVFLGSWRSTLIIAISIPLSILTLRFALSAHRETINIIALCGLLVFEILKRHREPRRGAEKDQRHSWFARSKQRFEHHPESLREEQWKLFAA